MTGWGAGGRRRGASVRCGGRSLLGPADIARLVPLAAMWGASSLFLREPVKFFGAGPLSTLRVLIAGLAVVAFVIATGGSVGWRRHW